MNVFLDEKTKRPIVTADEAGARLKIHPSNVRIWAMNGELSRIVESPRRVYYYLDDVKRLASKKSATRKKRGGRPRKDDAA